MAAPRYEIVQKSIQNPHASAPLFIPILVLCNTSDEDLARNISENSARELRWVKAEEPHGREAIMVGGGPSAADFIEEISRRQLEGGVVFAMNGASRWLRRYGIVADYQVISDAKEETAGLVDPLAHHHLFASQVNPKTMAAVEAPIVWHLEIGEIERHFPPAKVARGGYALIGGGAACGNSALCVAYAMGYRTLHLYGYDSCHRAGESHAYRQAMNDFIPTVDVEWAGKTYTASVAMKAQAEKFQLTGQALQQAGCALHVYGDGLLQHMWTAPPEHLSERDKYRLLWRYDTYRETSPGEMTVDAFLATARPDGLVIDFGCGTGRAALRLQEAGIPVLCVDFADNCRDDEALGLPFLEWDLTKPCPARAKWGFCSDVMEHIPPADVDAVLANLFEAAERVFFRIDTDDDELGGLIGHKLHLSVWPHEEWRRRIEAVAVVEEEMEGAGVSIFYARRKEQ